MDHAFEERKMELEQECVVPAGMFADVRNRLERFIEPFLESFVRYKQCDHATTVVSGLCSDLERKNAESIVYHFGLDRKTIQHFIGESLWDDAPLRIEMANQISEQLGADDGVLKHKQKYRTRTQMCLGLLKLHSDRLPHSGSQAMMRWANQQNFAANCWQCKNSTCWRSQRILPLLTWRSHRQPTMVSEDHRYVPQFA